MATETIDPVIRFPEGFDARSEAEMTDKGYLSGVSIRFEGGRQYRVNFIDPVRLAQDLERETEAGNPYFAEPGMIVLPSITRDAVQNAVVRLAAEGFFAELKPVSSAGEPGNGFSSSRAVDRPESMKEA